MKHQWTRVVFAADCPGPTQDEYEYKEKNGVMYARERDEESQ